MPRRRPRVDYEPYATVSLHEDELTLLLELVGRIQWSLGEEQLLGISREQLRDLHAALRRGMQLIQARKHRHRTYPS